MSTLPPKADISYRDRHHWSMPTDLRAVSARKRKAQAQTKTNITIITIVLVYFIICLSMLVLLFADQSFSKAAIELMGFF